MAEPLAMTWRSPHGVATLKVRGAWVAAGLLLATLVTFSPLLGAGFLNFDDPVYVSQNARVLQGLTWDNVHWAFTTIHWFYYPLTWLSHMLDTDLFGAWVGGRHLMNILLHAAAALLLFAFLRKTTGALWRSALVAALFSLHPLRVESVAWIAERKDTLSAALFMALLLLYANYAQRPSVTRYAAVFLAFMAALMAKSTVVMAPLILLLLDYWPLGRLGARTPWGPPAQTGAGAPRGPGTGRLILEKLPLLALSACFSLLTVAGQKGAMDPTGSIQVWDRVWTACSNYGGFIGKALAPFGLAIVYPITSPALLLRNGLLGAGLLALGTLLAFRLGRKHPYVPVGWLWYLLYMLPVVGFVQVGVQPTTDRAAYVPMVGLSIIVAWGAGDLAGQSIVGRRVAAALASLILVSFAAGTYGACRHWRDGATLFAHAAAAVPGNYQAFSLLGQALEERGDLPGAEAAMRRATSLAPWFTEAWGNLANVLCEEGRTEEAEACYRRVLTLTPADPRAANNLGLLLESKGRTEEAESLFRKALISAPAYVNARVNLSRVLLLEGRVDEARTQARSALRQDPYSEKARQAVQASDQAPGRAGVAP
jgi:protein O-mannosyl-transferase